MSSPAITNKDLLKKHAAIIHCSNNLSLLQRKISNCLLFHAYHELLSQSIHCITIKQLCNMIGYQGNNHAIIKKALLGLISTVLEWNLVDNVSSEESWTASTILASIQIKGALCSYSYSPHMKELLYTPSNYAKINLMIQSRFNSSYGLALYENCMRYENLPHTRWFDIPIFRKLMGVPANEYVIFRDLKRRVIDKSIEEVNTHSQITIRAEYEKVLRQVTQIRFMIDAKQPVNANQDLILAEVNNNPSLHKLVTNFGFSLQNAEKVIEQFGKVEIDKAIAGINFAKIRNVKNKAGYLITILKNQLDSSTQTKQLIEHRNEINSLAEQRKKEVVQKENLDREYLKYKVEFYYHWVEESTNKESIYNEFANYINELESPIKDFINQFCKNDVKKPPTNLYFMKFIEDKFSEVKQVCMSLEQYAATICQSHYS